MAVALSRRLPAPIHPADPTLTTAINNTPDIVNNDAINTTLKFRIAR